MYGMWVWSIHFYCQIVIIIIVYSFNRKLSNPTYIHTHLTALFPGLPRWAGTRKVKPIWILLEQETVSGSGISWAMCKSAPHSRQITTPAPHHSVFYRPGALPAAQPTVSKHWRPHIMGIKKRKNMEHWQIVVTVQCKSFPSCLYNFYILNRFLEWRWGIVVLVMNYILRLYWNTTCAWFLVGGCLL